jgi:hypothetical protein
MFILNPKGKFDGVRFPVLEDFFCGCIVRLRGVGGRRFACR